MIIIIGLLACKEEQKTDESWAEIVRTDQNSDFRGVKMGDDIRKVLAMEGNNVVYNMPDELTCRIPLDQKDSTFYEITYNFNDKGLYVIDLVIFPKDSFALDQMFYEFKSYYDRRYGESDVSAGYTAWYTTSSSGSDVEITMIDESQEKQQPFLSITFYEAEGISP